MAAGVVVSIDGRDIEVAPNTGLVEAAAHAGIEIPVFCYEPRIGPAVGACRMCLVSVEGMPKLQTACSTTVRPGMVVSTVGKREREAQEAVLEFLLVNHPLDCPVCDKGGECPLQDHAFRWGPGTSRFLETKRTNDKPIPISPLIALDRERCILCYRCTRFSNEVSNDDQLITRERGASSVIATFEGRPYAGHFSGNVVELCPVGALTSTEYRFKARPWEAPDHPTVCGLCPVGCSTHATVREGKVVRVIARENEDVDNGWLCDRGRFSYTSLYAEGRIVIPLSGRGDDAVEVSMEGALEALYQRLAADSAPTWVLSGNETIEEAFAVQQVAAQSGGRVVAAEGGAAAGPEGATAATLADLAAADEIVVLGDAEIVDTAPVAELRVRAAMRRGAGVTLVGIGGSKLQVKGAAHVRADAGDLEATVASLASGKGASDDVAALRERLTSAGNVVVIVRDGELSTDVVRQLASKLLKSDGSGLLAVPARANSRGLSALGIEPVGLEGLRGTSELVFVNIDPERLWPDSEWREVVGAASWVATITQFHNELTALADLVIGATPPLEKEGTLVNLEGRLQRLTPGGATPDGVVGELAWMSGVARRLGGSLPAYAAGAFRLAAASAEGRLPASTYADITLGGLLGVQGVTLARPATPPAADAHSRELSVFVAPNIFDAEDVDHARRMEFLHDEAWITVATVDAKRFDLQRRGQVLVDLGDGSEVVAARVAVSDRIAPGHARMLTGSGGAPRLSGYRTCSLERVPDAEPVGS